MHLHSPAHIFIAIKVVLFFVIAELATLAFLSAVFPSPTIKRLPLRAWLYILVSIVTAGLALKGVYFRGYSHSASGVNLLASPLIGVFIGYTLLTIVWTLANLWRRRRGARGILKNQLMYLFVGSLLLLVIVPVTNFLLPVAFKINAFASISPLYTLGFTGLIAYAVVRQRLFDIRLVVATSATYLLSLVTFGLIYGFGIYGVSQVVFGTSGQRGVAEETINVIFIVILAFLFQPMKNFFDRWTNRFFYRDAYDERAVLNQVNSVLTEEISLNKITGQCLKIICQNLKIPNGLFVVMDGRRIYKSSAYGQASSQITAEELANFRQSVTLFDLLLPGMRKSILARHNFDAVFRMSNQDGLAGYLLFGTKQSGNILTDQDVRLLGIISKELAVGVQNARAFEEIQQFNVTLSQRVDAATLELRHANSRLKELDAAKDEFISMASHQLRTPLTTIKGYLSMVLEGDAGPVKDSQRAMLEQAFNSSSRMVYLIADLLNVSRLQSGKFVITNKPTDLSKVVEGEISQLKNQAANRQVSLTYQKPDTCPQMNLDEDKIRQVVMNFLDNALYYTPAGGSVTAQLTANPKEVTYTVTDTGVGVPKSVQHHLFSKFYRAENARKMRPDGTGLGLYMAKKVITAQGGAIIFKSTEGQGSTFGFSLPRESLELK